MQKIQSIPKISSGTVIFGISAKKFQAALSRMLFRLSRLFTGNCPRPRAETEIFLALGLKPSGSENFGFRPRTRAISIKETAQPGKHPRQGRSKFFAAFPKKQRDVRNLLRQFLFSVIGWENGRCQ